MASDSDSLKELTASDSLVNKPRGLDTRAGVARTFVLVLSPAPADAAALLEDKVNGVADDAPGEDDDAMMQGVGAPSEKYC